MNKEEIIPKHTWNKWLAEERINPISMYKNCLGSIDSVLFCCYSLFSNIPNELFNILRSLCNKDAPKEVPFSFLY